MAKSKSIKIKLLSIAGTGTFYITKRNSRTSLKKIEKRKYDSVIRSHVIFKEVKIK